MSHVVCMPDDAVGGPQVGLLEAAGFTVEQAPPGSSAAPVDDLAALLAGAAAVIASAEPYSRELLARLPGLRVISRRGVAPPRGPSPGSNSKIRNRQPMRLIRRGPSKTGNGSGPGTEANGPETSFSGSGSPRYPPSGTWSISGVSGAM